MKPATLELMFEKYGKLCRLVAKRYQSDMWDDLINVGLVALWKMWENPMYSDDDYNDTKFINKVFTVLRGAMSTEYRQLRKCSLAPVGADVSSSQMGNSITCTKKLVKWTRALSITDHEDSIAEMTAREISDCEKANLVLDEIVGEMSDEAKILLDFLRDGHSQREAADKFGLSRNDVKNFLREVGMQYAELA